MRVASSAFYLAYTMPDWVGWAVPPDSPVTWYSKTNDVITAIASHWPNNDLAAAITWVKQLPEGPAKQQAVNGVVSRWAGEDPKAAATYVQSLPPGNSRGAVLNSIAGQWAAKDPDAALACVARLSCCSLRSLWSR